MTQDRPSTSDFASLRDAFATLAEIIDIGGQVALHGSGVKLTGIPRDRWAEMSMRARREAAMIRTLIQGTGQRASVAGRREVVLSVIAADRGGERHFDIAALLVSGRGSIARCLAVTSQSDDWRERLSRFVDWEHIDGVIAAAEGNNQRAMIGLVLQLSGIGRGKLSIVEADLPQEIEEAAQMVKGADWMKAGLPRFTSAAAEALWYLMRIRSVHARMIKERKQGYYTSMGLAAMLASGIDLQRIAEVTGMPQGLVEKLTPGTASDDLRGSRLSDLGHDFAELDAIADARMSFCAGRVWKGAAIYAHIMDRRIRLGKVARAKIADGGDLVSIAADLKISRRDLIRILSVRQDEALAEKARFVAAVIDPDMVRRAVL